MWDNSEHDSESLLVDYALQASKTSKEFSFINVEDALKHIKLHDKIENDALRELWRSECESLDIDPSCGTVLLKDFLRIACKASILPGWLIFSDLSALTD